jgi:hypothetical protein
MGEHEGEIAKLTERSENQGKEIKALQDNQKWAVVTLLGLVIKTAFDYLTKGTTP